MSTPVTPGTTGTPAATRTVVIGAGIAGASAAAALAARAPGTVTLVEQEPLPAHHASGRSASLLNETSGHPMVCALAHLSRPFFEHPPAGFADHPLLTPRGLLWVGESGDEPLLDALAAAARRINPNVRRIDAAAVNEVVDDWSPFAVAAGGVFEPDAMSIDTAAVIAGFLRSFQQHGGTTLLTHEAVHCEQRADSSWLVHTSHGTLPADHVVNAAGAWADIVATRAGLDPLGMRALRRTAALVPAPDSIAHWPLVMDIAGRYYCEPEPGGLLVSPADETPTEPCDAQPDELDVALALDRVREATRLPLRSVRRAWAGLRTFAPDRAPVLGPDPTAPGFWWYAGQGGAGIKTAPAMGNLLARMVHGEPLGTDAAELGVDASTLGPARLRAAR